MKKNNSFNKKIFAMLIDKARGDRTIKEFARDCGISYVQLHKLELGNQENAPGIKLITKLANASDGGINIEDYFFAAGISNEAEVKVKKKKSLDIRELFDNLTSSQQKTVYDFMDYLLNYKK